MNTLAITKENSRADLNKRIELCIILLGKERLLILIELVVLKIFSIINKVVQTPAKIKRIVFIDFMVFPYILLSILNTI